MWFYSLLHLASSFSHRSHLPSTRSSIHHLPPLRLPRLCPSTFLCHAIPLSFSPNLLFLPLAHFLSCRLRPHLITANTPLRVGRDCHAAKSKVTSSRNRDVLWRMRGASWEKHGARCFPLCFSLFSSILSFLFRLYLPSFHGFLASSFCRSLFSSSMCCYLNMLPSHTRKLLLLIKSWNVHSYTPPGEKELCHHSDEAAAPQLILLFIFKPLWFNLYTVTTVFSRIRPLQVRLILIINKYIKSLKLLFA